MHDDGALDGIGGCVPSVASSTFWYLDATSALVPGTRAVTQTCSPALTTIVYTDAAGGVLNPVPQAVSVDYTVNYGGAAGGTTTAVVTPEVNNTELAEIGCASGAHYTRITRSVWSAAGALQSASMVYRNAAGTETTIAPVGFTLGECPASTTALEPKALTGVGAVTITPPDALVWSITVTREANGVQYSLNSGTTWATMNANGSRSWSSASGRMLNTSTMRFRGTAAGSRFDVIWEV